MFRVSLFKAALLLCISVYTVNAQAKNEKYFRYYDENNTLVINSTIPPALVPKGYEIISQSGRVIEKVEPALTKEELQAQQIRLQQQKIKMQQEEAQNQQDELLLKVFASKEDIKRKYHNDSEAIKSQIEIAKTHINRLNTSAANYKRQAIEMEKSGQIVPKKLLDNIEEIESQIGEHEKFIARKNENLVEVEEEYQEKLKNFTRIKGKAAMIAN